MQKVHRIVLVDIIDSHHNQHDALKNLQELKSLVATYNGIEKLKKAVEKTLF